MTPQSIPAMGPKKILAMIMGMFPRLTLIVSVLTRGRNLSKIMLNAVSIATLVMILILFFGIKNPP
jgi:hypothetical protein